MATPRGNGTQLLGDVRRTVGRYIRGQLLITLVMMVLYGAGFYVVEAPLWLLAGFLCGLFHLVPMVGAVLGAFIPILFVLLGGGGLRQVLLVLLVFALAQAVESFYLTPKILGAELSLRPVVVFFTVLLGGFAFGVMGALVAVPAVAVAILVWKTVQKRQRSPGGS